jgi:large subunit ribosomal protein L30e
MVKILDKVLKDAVTADKYKCGAKQVLHSIKGSKLIVVSNTIPPNFKSKIELEANQENVPIYPFDGNSFRLGKLCNKPFRINAIALKSGTDAQINSILSDIQLKESKDNNYQRATK